MSILLEILVMVNGHIYLQKIRIKMDEWRIQYQIINLLDLEYILLKWSSGKYICNGLTFNTYYFILYYLYFQRRSYKCWFFVSHCSTSNWNSCIQYRWVIFCQCFCYWPRSKSSTWCCRHSEVVYLDNILLLIRQNLANIFIKFKWYVIGLYKCQQK